MEAFREKDLHDLSGKKSMKFSLAYLFFALVCSLLFNPGQSLALEKEKVTLPDGQTIEVQVADNADTRERGLMGASQLSRSSGMLFVFETNKPHGMWMKNMDFSIDILWLNQEKKIVEISSSLPPCQREPCPIYGSDTLSRYVLELSDGASSFYHLRKGAQLKFP
jgi:uncharacterized membrane protein (UPF0127 family)